MTEILDDFIIENNVLVKYKGNSGDVIVPDSVTSIGESAFEACSSLTSIVIPNGVTSIGIGAFAGCSKLESIVVEPGNVRYKSRNNCLIDITDNSLVLDCKNSVIPKSVTRIGDYAFDSCSSLTSITIPSSVTSIGESAFEGCSSLASIIIPNGVASIGNRAFMCCCKLKSITIPNSVTNIGDGAFIYCLLRMVTLNKDCKVGDDAFDEDCKVVRI